MKKLIYSFLVLSFAGSAFAAVSPNGVVTPRDQRGEAAHPLYGGYANTRVTATTSEIVVCSGRCVLAAMILNTAPVASQVRIRNSSVANGVGVLAIKHNYNPVNTEPGNNPIRLPMFLDKGITVQLTASGAQEEVEVLYLDMD
jgi:hypothetical protein